MNYLKKGLDKLKPKFAPGQKWHVFAPIYDAFDSFCFTTGEVTQGRTHVRDGLDLKRIMSLVVIAVFPSMIFGIYNTGHQIHLAISKGASPLDAWQTHLFSALGGSFNPSVLNDFFHGLCWYFPIFLVTFVVGGGLETLFALVRRQTINEGFLVTGTLFPLILPVTIPLWQVALGIAFGVVVGKEVFGGTGTNFMNPALVGRAFLFFAYPSNITGESIWTAAQFPDGLSGATLLHNAHENAQSFTFGTDWWNAFFGQMGGAIGETSAFLCLLGGLFLLLTQIISWRIVLGIAIGTTLTATLLNLCPDSSNPMFSLPFYWHMVLGGWAFGCFFMATDPVTSAMSLRGKWIYGLLLGALIVTLRVFNPAYPEGVMLAILFMNMLAPLIDHMVIAAHIRRRTARDAH